MALIALLSACGGDESADDTADDTMPRVVVTTSILGAVVNDLVGDRAEVTVVMPDGVDPHDWEPSAKDLEVIGSASIVVANGLHLEETLEDALDAAADDGVDVFEAGDHVDIRMIDGDAHGDEHGDEHGAEDPHLWLDPLAMSDVVEALAAELAAVGLDVSDRLPDVTADLDALSREIEQILTSVPADRRELVTGHESLGYYADRYGLELVGAVIPSVSSQAEASAGDLAELGEVIAATGVGTIFTEPGTPDSVVEAIADETGAAVVEISTHDLPADGTYRSFMLELTRTIADGLAD